MAVKFKELVLNSEGKDVLEASKLLAKSGSSLKPTSKFNIGMLSAVRSFQKKHKLAVTGIINKTTWNKLQTYKLVRSRKAKN